MGGIVFMRLIKWGTGIAALAALSGLIFHFRLWERDWSTIDDGWASLIGSAMGSFLAVVGALYVSKAEERRKKKEFEDFVKVAVQNLVVQASYLEAMAREPHKIASTPEVQAGIISIQLRNLTDALAVFDREIAASRDGSYKLRQNIVSLDSMLAESRHGLVIDSHPSQVFNNWHVGAYQVRQYASAFLDAFAWYVPIPTTNLIGETIKKHVTAWRSWNVPVSHNTVIDQGQNTPYHSLHTAHA